MIVPSLSHAVVQTAAGLGLVAVGAACAARPGPLRRAAAALARLARPLRSAKAGGLAICVAGVALVATGGAAVCDYDPVPALGLSSPFDLSPERGLVDDDALRATTDRGRPVALRTPAAPRD